MYQAPSRYVYLKYVLSTGTTVLFKSEYQVPRYFCFFTCKFSTKNFCGFDDTVFQCRIKREISLPNFSEFKDYMCSSIATIIGKCS